MRETTIKILGVQCGAGGAQAGSEDGPFVLRQKGVVQRLAGLGHQVEDMGDVPGVYQTRFAISAGGNVNKLPRILLVNRHTHACVLGMRRKDPQAFLLVIGGDHSLAIGTLAGLSDSCNRLGILWIDAHADFNTPESSPSGNLHGMPLAVACGKGPRDLRHIADRDPMVRETDVIIIGCRDIDRDERANLNESAVTLIEMDAWRQRGLAATVLDAAQQLASRCDHVHLSFDIDVLDPEVAPGTGTPVAGGLTAAEGLELLAALAQSNLIHSAEFVEYNPKLDPDGRTCKTVIDLVEALLNTRVPAMKTIPSEM